jgi:hypothetical protein
VINKSTKTNNVFHQNWKKIKKFSRKAETKSMSTAQHQRCGMLATTGRQANLKKVCKTDKNIYAPFEKPVQMKKKKFKNVHTSMLISAVHVSTENIPA